MDDMSKTALAVSLPLWTSMAVLGAFAVYYAGVAGLGIMFIVIIVVVFYWNKTLTTFSEKIGKVKEQPSSERDIDSRVSEIESKLDEIARKQDRSS